MKTALRRDWNNKIWYSYTMEYYAANFYSAFEEYLKYRKLCIMLNET